MCADIATAVGLGVLSTSSPFSKSPSWSLKDHLCCNSDITEHMVQLWVGWPYEPPLLTSIDLRHIRQYYLETYLSLSFLYFYVSVFLQSLQYGISVWKHERTKFLEYGDDWRGCWMVFQEKCDITHVMVGSELTFRKNVTFLTRAPNNLMTFLMSRYFSKTTKIIIRICTLYVW